MTKDKIFWWGEVGENFRTKLFNKNEGNGAILWEAYVKQMLSSLEITIPKKSKPAGTLVEEAKKLGAVEEEPKQ